MTSTKVSFVVYFITALAASKVFAASGTVTGTIYFTEAEGNFCPTTRDCTGALYTQNQFGTLIGIPNVKVWLQNSSDQVIGSGSTDQSGHYSIAWSTTGSLTDAHTVMNPDHKDNRFLVRNSVGSPIRYDIDWLDLVNGSTQDQGELYWGTTNSPDKYLNVYMGAFREWTNALSLSNKMVSLFTNVLIHVDSTVCATSCADATTKTIELDTGAPFAPQARIAHEMGHIASGLSDNHKNVVGNNGSYCYPQTTGLCGWTLGGDEWGSVAFEEGLATFIGDLSLYTFTANAPHTCLCATTSAGGSACSTNSFNEETSGGFVDEHAVINITRYLWDIYDDRVDSATSTAIGCGGTFSDNLGRDLFEVIDTLANYVVGPNSRQTNDPWNSALTAIDQFDGRRYHDFDWNYKNRGKPSNTSSDAQLCMNSGWPD